MCKTSSLNRSSCSTNFFTTGIFPSSQGPFLSRDQSRTPSLLIGSNCNLSSTLFREGFPSPKAADFTGLRSLHRFLGDLAGRLSDYTKSDSVNIHDFPR